MENSINFKQEQYYMNKINILLLKNWTHVRAIAFSLLQVDFSQEKERKWKDDWESI